MQVCNLIRFISLYISLKNKYLYLISKKCKYEKILLIIFIRIKVLSFQQIILSNLDIIRHEFLENNFKILKTIG